MFAVPCLLLLATVCAADLQLEARVPYQYAVVLDAGSSGTRVNVYRWKAGGRGIEHDRIESMTPALKMPNGLASTLGDKQKVREHLQPLIVNASYIVPTGSHATTPIYILATAGMRLMLEDQMNAVMDFVDGLMQEPQFNPFYYQPSHGTRVLSGEEEGGFAWIAANYAAGKFSGSDVEGPPPTVGIVEMGGASAQIAFSPHGSVLDGILPVHIAGTEYSVYVHSYLAFGQDLVNSDVKRIVMEESPDRYQLNEPCMLIGDREYNPKFNRTYVGTGDVVECLRILDQLVFKVDALHCQPKPCAIGSTYQPTLPSNMTFYAVGAFIYTLKAIQALDSASVYVPDYGLKMATDYCSTTLEELKKRPSYDSFARYNCMRGLYINKLFTKGYGFLGNSTQIYVLDKINGISTAWTLGAVIFEHIEEGSEHVESAAAAAAEATI